MTKHKLTLSQLEQYLSKAAWILKGPVDASDFKVYIFPLLFFKRISDVYDEEFRIAFEESGGDAEYADLPEFHRFVIPEDCHWKNVRLHFGACFLPKYSCTLLAWKDILQCERIRLDVRRRTKRTAHSNT